MVPAHFVIDLNNPIGTIWRMVLLSNVPVNCLVSELALLSDMIVTH